MRPRSVFIALLSSCAALLSAPVRAEQLRVGNETRTYLMYVPPAVAAARKPAPLVLVLHGGRGTGEAIRGWSGMDRVADRNGFVVAYPDGIGRQWNDGRGIGSQADDVGFITALVESLVSRGVAERSRIYVAGASNGGLMTYRLACETDGLFAGYAAVIANLTPWLVASCARRSPRRIMIMNGTEDRVMPFAGGSIMGDRGEVISTDATLQFWAGRAGCRLSAAARMPDFNPQDGTVTDVVRCGSGQVVLYRIIGGGHQWPSTTRAARPLFDRFVGATSRDFDASDHIWRFFRGELLP